MMKLIRLFNHDANNKIKTRWSGGRGGKSTVINEIGWHITEQVDDYEVK